MTQLWKYCYNIFFVSKKQLWSKSIIMIILILPCNLDYYCPWTITVHVACIWTVNVIQSCIMITMSCTNMLFCVELANSQLFYFNITNPVSMQYIVPLAMGHVFKIRNVTYQSPHSDYVTRCYFNIMYCQGK